MTRYQFLSAPANLIAWARALITALNQRDTEIEKRLAALEAKSGS